MSGTGPEPPRPALTEAALWRVACRALLLVFALIAGVWLLVRLQAVVIQVLLALILAAGMTPLVNRLAPNHLTPGGRRGRRRGWRPPRALLVLAVYALLVAVVVAVGALVLPPVVSEIEDLVRRLPSYATDFQGWLALLPERYPFLPADFTGGLNDLLRTGASQLAGFLDQALVVVRLVLGVLGGALNGIFILFLALYITVDNERIQRYLVGFLPPDRRDQALEVTGRIGDRLGGWLRGQFMLSAIIGTLTLAGLSLIGVRYAMLLSLIAAVGEAVPMVGPIFSAVPAVIIAFFQSPLQGFLTLGLYVLIQQVENSLVVPKVMERAVALHPLAVMVALLAGAELLGVTGAILSVPVAAALSVVVDEVRRERDERHQVRAAPAVRPQPERQPELTSPKKIQTQAATTNAVDSTVTTIAPTQPPPAMSQ